MSIRLAMTFRIYLCFYSLSPHCTDDISSARTRSNTCPNYNISKIDINGIFNKYILKYKN